ncbi:lysosomal alpha-glucosidase-like protein, partial [Leptotrombidium deliense]
QIDIPLFSALKRIRPEKRPFVLSRSTFSGQGKYGTHWSGDVSSNWDDLRFSIPSILDFNVFGIPFVGADICGFWGSTTEELCARWMSLGAFYPFARNHNTANATAQDPAALGPKVISASKKAFNIRYTLIPHLYTLFYRAHNFGETVARPLFFNFPKDTKTYKIETQFMWGSHILII